MRGHVCHLESSSQVSKWNSKAYPDGCRHCGTTERTCLGRGLCSRCYQDDSVRYLYDTMRKDDDVADSENLSQDHATVGQPDDADSAGNRGDLVEEPMTTWLDDSLAGSGERRPGGRSSSSPAGPDSPEPTTLADKLKDRLNKLRAPKPAQEVPPKTKEKTPRAKGGGRRISAADTLGDLWGGAGTVAMRTGHVPLGRCLQFQAPVAGEMLDEALRGSIVDKIVLQKVAKGRSRFDALGAVFGPPAIVLMMERHPEQMSVLMPILKTSIRSSLPLMVPAIKKVQMKEAAAAEAAAELFPDLAPGEDPVDAIIAMMFADFIPP